MDFFSGLIRVQSGPAVSKVLHEVGDQSSDSQGEQDEYDPHNRGDILSLAGKDLQKYPAHNREHDTGRDGVGQGHHGQGQEGTDGIRQIAIIVDLLGGS